jgi:hypothetical protein
MIPTLDLVVRVPALAVIAALDPTEDAKAILDESLSDAMCAHLVLDPGPNLVRVRDGLRRPPTERPAAIEQTRLVAVGEYPISVRKVSEAVPEVVTDD